MRETRRKGTRTRRTGLVSFLDEELMGSEFLEYVPAILQDSATFSLFWKTVGLKNYPNLALPAWWSAPPSVTSVDGMLSFFGKSE